MYQYFIPHYFFIVKSIVYSTFYFCIHRWVDIWVVSTFLAIVSDAAGNVCVQVSVGVCFNFFLCLHEGIAEPHGPSV